MRSGAKINYDQFAWVGGGAEGRWIISDLIEKVIICILLALSCNVLRRR